LDKQAPAARGDRVRSRSRVVGPRNALIIIPRRLRYSSVGVAVPCYECRHRL